MLANYLHPARAAEAIAELTGDALRSVPAQRTQVVPHPAGLDRTVASQIITEYQGGALTHELAKRYCVRRNTVRDLLRRAGFDTMARAKCASLSSDQRLEMRHLRGNGATREELARSFQVSESTVKRILAPDR